MQWQLLFLSLPPVVVFMAFDARGRPRRAVVAAVATSALELVYNSVALDMIEPFSTCSFALFAVLGGASLATRDERFFKLQPAFFELLLAATIWYYGFARGIPLLATLAERYVGIHQALSPYQRGYATVYATTLSRSAPYLLVVHAAITAFGAWRRSSWWWFNVRVFGLYAALALLFVLERLLGVTP